MVPRVAVMACMCALSACACSKASDGEPIGERAPGSAASAVKAGSNATSFSADLAKELGPGSALKNDGKRDGSDAPENANNAAAAGDEAKGAAGGRPIEATSSAAASAGASPDPAQRSGEGAPRSGAASSGTASAPSVATPSAGAASAGATVTPPPRLPERTAASSAGAEPPQEVKVPTDLAAIKISLLPNWDRDVGEAGTFQYVVRVKGTQSTKTFMFRYGYDDPKAPRDREQYKKYLQDSKLLLGEIKDRQRGGAWFLEGNDASGLPAFRYVVLYGGKHLICYGSLYKDAESSRLGDDRDQTVIQAKQICETLAL
jgi:hypothetical protein